MLIRITTKDQKQALSLFAQKERYPGEDNKPAEDPQIVLTLERKDNLLDHTFLTREAFVEFIEKQVELHNKTWDNVTPLSLHRTTNTYFNT